MRDDVPQPGLGRVPDQYDKDFLDRAFRQIEKTFQAMLALGPIRVTEISDPSDGVVTIDGLSLSGDITVDDITADDATFDDVTIADLIVSNTLKLPQGSAPAPTTEGDLRWDTDDNAMVAGDGSAQKIFRPGNWDFIGVSNPSSSSSVTFTNLSPYRILRIIGRIRPATDATSIRFRTSTNNGSSYDSGASDYVHSYLFQSAATAAGTDTVAGTSFAPNATGIGNTAPEGISFDLLIQEWNQSLQCTFLFSYMMLNTSTSHFVGITSGRRASTTARNAIEITMSSGNIADGHIEIWGTRGTA